MRYLDYTEEISMDSIVASRSTGIIIIEESSSLKEMSVTWPEAKEMRAVVDFSTDSSVMTSSNISTIRRAISDEMRSLFRLYGG